MAKMIPTEVIDEVRNSVNIADIVGRYVQLRKAGKNLFGLCPFHDEKTPSFSVSEDKQIFHCFSCGRGGNVFKFLMDLEHISFPEAVAKVAELANIPIDQQYIKKSQPTDNYSNSQAALIKLNKQAADLYHHILVNTELGKKALNYLKQRGMTAEDIEKFKIGFAPAENDLLLDFFQDKDVTDEVLNNSGLFVESNDGNLHDRFFNRIMFPIEDNSGKVIAFSGRVLEKQYNVPKYLNSPETSIFNKSKVLYNFYNARNEIIQNKSVILYEGFMDVIASNRAGVENAIATMGTSLTQYHINEIGRVCQNVTLCFDGDAPGQKAIAHSIDLINQYNSSLKIKVIFIPDNQDPDEYIGQYGSISFQDLMTQNGESSMSFFMKYERRDLNLANESDRLTYIKRALTRLAVIKDAIEQDIYLNQLADEFKIDKADLKNQLRQIQASQIVKESHQESQRLPENTPQNPAVITQNVSQKKDKVEASEYCLLNRALNNQDVWLKLQNIPDFYFPDEQLETIYMLAGGYLAQNHNQYQVADFMDYLKEASLQETLSNVESLELDPEVSEDEIDDYVKIIMDDAPLVEKIKQVKADLDEATRLGNQKLQQQLAIELINLYQKQQQLQR